MPPLPWPDAPGDRLPVAGARSFALPVGLRRAACTLNLPEDGGWNAAIDVPSYVAIERAQAMATWRPQRSLSGFLPIATVLVGVCMAVTFADQTANLHVATHVWSIIGVGAAWLLEAIALRGPVRRLRLAA